MCTLVCVPSACAACATPVRRTGNKRQKMKNDRYIFHAPLGVASSLRRTKSERPCMQSRDGARPVSTTRRSPESIVVRARAESPAIISTGPRPVGNKRLSAISPERAKSGWLIRCRPFRATEAGSPLFTGRCPVLMITGLSALHLTPIVSMHAK
jgi:hypothetical protein